MNNIAKIIGLVALTGATTLAFAGEGCNHNRSAQGQGEFHQGHHKGMHGDKNDMSPEERQAFMVLKIEKKLNRMTRGLDLTPKQQVQVREILKTRQQNMHQIRQDSRMQIDKVLSDEQRQKMQSHSRG